MGEKPRRHRPRIKKIPPPFVESPYINPFIDFAFKKIFASETSRDLLKAFLNEVMAGIRHIQKVEYSKNEYPGEIKKEGGAVFDIVCTDDHGAKFLIEVQRAEQENFKERSVFYASRLISDQAPKGDRRDWAYKLKEVYTISLLENFNLPDTQPNEYFHDISLGNGEGNVFYSKLSFIYIELNKFLKKPEELETGLDQWLYALKHMTKFSEQPSYLKEPEIEQLFNLAKLTNLTPEEREMYRTAQQVRWDNQNVMDFAKKQATKQGLEQGLAQGLKQGLEQGKAQALAEKKEMAREMKKDKFPIEQIAKLTKLPLETIQEL